MSLKSFFSVALGLLSLIWIVLGLVCLIDSAKPKLYIVDIFTLPLLMGCIVWLILMALGRQGPAGLITGLALIIFIASHWPSAYPNRPKADPAATPVKVMFHNLWFENPSGTGLLTVIDKEQPDIIGLIEVSNAAKAELLPGLGDRYPYRDLYGDRLVLSRFPLKNVAHGRKLNTTHAEVRTPDGPINLFTVHLTRPWPFKRGSQFSQIERMESFMQPYDKENALVLGDFNSTPSAALLRGFAKRQGLNPAPAPIGTWPDYLPGVLRLGIDNGLAGQDLRFNARHVGGATGSDHLPVIFVLTRAQKTSKL